VKTYQFPHSHADVKATVVKEVCMLHMLCTYVLCKTNLGLT